MTERMERGGGISLWRQIAERIRGEIAGGILQPGDRLPPEAELAERFGVNRHTLRRAMAALVQDGMVRVDQGRGTFVETGRLDYPIGRRTRFSEIVSAQARAPGGRMIGHAREEVAGLIAERLALAPGTLCHRIETLSAADGVPISTSTNWLPVARFPDAVDIYAATGSFTRVFEAHGIGDYSRRTTRISARPADAEDASRLALTAGATLLITENVDVDGAGVPVQTGRTRFSADRVELVVDSG